MNQAPIGLFDSGMGGLSVLAALKALMPNENYLYYADTANMPYGNLSDSDIYRLTYRGLMYLVGRGVKCAVIACNTATNVGIGRLRPALGIEITGMEPAVKPAAQSGAKNILIATTLATYNQQKFRELVQSHAPDSAVCCPSKDLARTIEDNPFSQEVLLDAVTRQYGKFSADTDAAVLGCTHYVLIKPLFARVLSGAKLFDGNAGTAAHVHAKLERAGLLSQRNINGDTEIITSCGSRERATLYRDITARCNAEGSIY